MPKLARSETLAKKGYTHACFRRPPNALARAKRPAGFDRACKLPERNGFKDQIWFSAVQIRSCAG